MFHEEKIIEGILCYRTTPNENFRAFTKQQLTQKILNLQEEIKRAKYLVDEGE